MNILTCRESATELARRGIHVFPLLWRSKEPLRHSRGHLDASDDLVLTRRRWAGKLCNVGVRTGTEIGNGFLNVLDIDGDAGYRKLADLERQHGPLPVTLTVKTSRGEHRYLIGPELNSRIGFLPGLDWKSSGGYVVGPCSVHPSGAVYQCQDWDAPIATAPEWVLDQVRYRPVVTRKPSSKPVLDSHAYGRAALNSEVDALNNVTVDRNKALVQSAFRMGQLVVLGKLDETLAFDKLVGAARDIGLGDKEARRTVKSGITGAVTTVWRKRHAS
jgi:hypothetical protein